MGVMQAFGKFIKFATNLITPQQIMPLPRGNKNYGRPIPQPQSQRKRRRLARQKAGKNNRRKK